MKILIDISHPAHINFFRNAISILKEKGHEIVITSLSRGNLKNIINREYDEFQVRFNGRHRGTKWSIIMEANILRFFQQLRFIISKKVDIALSCGSFTTGAIMKYVFQKPNIQFDDDRERKFNVLLERMTSEELIIFPNVKLNTKNKTDVLKEWAYLSPQYFSPSISILDNYGYKPKEYIFIREVSTGSLNYSEQQSNLIASFANILSNKYNVLFSLEDKSSINQYPSDWTLLKEPLEDIHSLIYFSKILISSGDSMAREGAMLGVPSIYCGIREMAANQVLINKGMLFHKKPNDIPKFVQEILNSNIRIDEQANFREKLKKNWIDVTDLIIKTIEKYQVA